MKRRNREQRGRKKCFLLGKAAPFLVPCLLLLVPLLAACKPNPAELKSLKARTEQVVESAKEKIESLEERFGRERTEMSARFEQQLKRTEARLAELRKRAEADAARRPEIERGIRALEERTKTLRDRLGRLKSATSDQWDQLKEPWQKKEGDEAYEDQILKETST